MSYLYTAGATGEEQRGPVDLSTLVQLAISGELTWETLVWAPSFADWQLASEIPELAAVLPPPAGAAAADAIFGGAAAEDAASNPFGEGGSVVPPPEANPFGGGGAVGVGAVVSRPTAPRRPGGACAPSFGL